jgi:hypothetical protein
METTRRTPGATYAGLSLIALLCLGSEFILAFPLFFAPGWANGWPGGLTIYQVWSTGMTIAVFVILATLGIALGSLLGFLLCIVAGGRLPVRILLWIWVATWSALSALVCVWVYREIYASALAMWPNGYPNLGP